MPGRPDLLAEVVYAARREQARTVGDVLLRRTRLALTAAREVTRRRTLLARSPRCWGRARSAEQRGGRGSLAEAAAEGVVVC